VTLVPPPEHSAGMENQGTLVLSGWPPAPGSTGWRAGAADASAAAATAAASSQAALACALESFGDIRALRPAPHAPCLHFVEFCDVRCAQAALDALSQPQPRPGMPRLAAEFGRMPPPRSRAATHGAASVAPAPAWPAASYTMVPLMQMQPAEYALPGAAPASPYAHHHTHSGSGGSWGAPQIGSAPDGSVFMGSDGYLYRAGVPLPQMGYGQPGGGAAAGGYGQSGYGGGDGRKSGGGGGGGAGYNGEPAAPRSPRGGGGAHPLARGARSGRRGNNRSRGGSSDDSDLYSPGGATSGPGSGGSGGSGGAHGGAGSGSGSPASTAAVRARAAELAAREASHYAFSAAEAASPSGRTTVMLKNIPNKCSRAALLGALDAAGLGAAYDFVYLPVDFKHRCNLGYAFLNMTTPDATGALHAAFHGRPWPEFRSRKVCAVSYARLQGRAALVTHFRTSRFPAEADDALPLLLHAPAAPDEAARQEVIGVRVPLPPGAAGSGLCGGGGGGGGGKSPRAAGARARADTRLSEGADESAAADADASPRHAAADAADAAAHRLAPAGAEQEEQQQEAPLPPAACNSVPAAAAAAPAVAAVAAE
jgi:hypothetical protein